MGEGVGWKLFITKCSGSATVRPPPTNEVCEGYVFTRVCLSMGGVVSQHALQGGGIPACLAGGVPAFFAGLQGGLQTHTQGWSWGVWPRGVSRPTPGGNLQAYTWGCVYPSMHWGRSPPWTATAAGGTHPTGMRSCLVLFWVNDIIRCRHRLCVDNMDTITSTESFIFSSSNNNYTRKVNQRSVRGEKVCGNHSLDVWLFFFSSLLVVLIMLWIFKRYFS